MKIKAYKRIIVAILAAFVVVPALVLAQSAPSTDGGNTGGATSNSTTPSTGGENTGGATSNNSTPSTSGGNTGGASSNSSTPSTGGGNTGGATNNPSTPSTGGGGTGGATSSSVPSTGGGNTGGASANVPSTGGGNTGGATSGSIPNTGGGNIGGATPNQSEGSSNNGGGSSGGSSRRRSSTTVLPPLVNVSQCLYLNTYLKYGWPNPVSEVTKLQNFLKNTEGINVNATGVFDLQTLNAVHTFQAKYLDDVMVPWGVRTTSGFVYYTTTKKINEIYCKKTFTLTPAQIAEIEAYRRNVANRSTTPTVESDYPVDVNPATGEPTPTSTPDVTEIGSNDNGSDSQTASAKTSIGEKIGNFFKWLFGIEN